MKFIILALYALVGAAYFAFAFFYVRAHVVNPWGLTLEEAAAARDLWYTFKTPRFFVVALVASLVGWPFIATYDSFSGKWGA